MIRRCNAAVAAIVLTPNLADEIPVVVEPEVPAAKFAFANTCPRAVASLVSEASEQITNVCIGLSYTKALTGKFESAPEPGQC